MKIIQPPRKRGASQKSVGNNFDKNIDDIALNRASKRRKNKGASQDRKALDAGVLNIGSDSGNVSPSKKRRRSELVSNGNASSSSTNEAVIDPAKKEYNKVLERGIRLLSMREHSVKEISDKLRAKTDNSKYIADVVDELLEKKYLSDERFAESYIRARANRGFGPIKIKTELKAKGVASVLIQEHLNEGSALWLDNAKSQYQKKYAQAKIESYNEWTKRARFLQGRGFNMDQIHCVLEPVDND